MNYVRCRTLLHEGGRVSGATVEDSGTGASIEVRAKLVVNATGIFVDQVRALDDAQTPALLSASRGTHIVVDRSTLSSDTALMVPKTQDGRVIFAIPWQGRVVIGTTDIAVTVSK